MKKNLLMIIVALFGFMLVSCKKDEPVKIENKYYDEASQLLDKYYNDFWIKGANRFKAYHPEDLSTGSEYRGTAALWGYGAAMTAVTSGLQVNPKDKNLIAKADELVKELEQYRYRSLSYRYYSAIVGGTGEPYYDDNAWVVISLYEMAEALGNDEYMTISREILDYVLSGEAEEGGLYWKESVISRNVAAIGPAIIGSLMHYQNKKEDVLLETAIRLYDWTVRVLRDPVDKVYWDNAIQREDGTEQIEYTKWTYNSGTMISAGLMLYEITKEEKYLTDARLTAEGSFNRFRTVDNTRDIAYFPATPWFNVYLARAYREMAIIDNNDKYINAFKEFADLAISRGKDKNGYIYPSWGSGSILSEYQYVSGLNQAGTIEILFVIANYELNKE